MSHFELSARFCCLQPLLFSDWSIDQLLIVPVVPSFSLMQVSGLNTGKTVVLPISAWDFHRELFLGLKRTLHSLVVVSSLFLVTIFPFYSAFASFSFVFLVLDVVVPKLEIQSHFAVHDESVRSCVLSILF